MALPDDLQLRRRLPPRHQHHEGDPRSLLRDRGATRLSGDGESGWDSLWHSVGAGAGEGSDVASGEPAGAGASTEAPAGLRLIVRTDGAARGNPGPASLGAVLIDAASPGSRRADALPLASISEYLGVQTNNVAEYTAALRALALAEELGAAGVEMLLDSKLIVEQLNGRWRVKDAKLIPLHAEARARLARFGRWSATHVPRAQNKQADALCNDAIDRVQAGGQRVVVVRP
ncbi:MAG: ribonuclease HI family protein [Candidatus Limnocylindrales bacterium]